MPNARAPPLLSDDVDAFVIINPCCGASPGQPGLAPSRKTGLNANTVPPVFNKPERMRPGRLVTGTARRSHGCTVTAQRRGTSKEPLRQNSETPTLQQLVITARIATLKLHFF